MDSLTDAKTVLKDAEDSLRSLVAKAVAEGHYDAVVAVTDWAKALRAMIDSATLPIGTAGQNSAISPTKRSRLRGQVGPGNASPRSPRPTRKKNGGYPRFTRDADALVKTAWSKASKAEYEHRAPRRVLSLVIDALARLGAGGSLVSMENVLPLVDAEGNEVPSYQVYVCLAWLREAALVVADGRRGYLVMSDIDLAVTAASCWEKLPKRSKPRS